MSSEQIDAFEKIPVSIFESPRAGSAYVAKEIASLIKTKQAEGKACILGLPTGSTPITLYRELVKLHREEGLSFSNVISFNLDEYYPLSKDAPQSFWSFMHRHLFDHVDIPAENIYIPDGNWSRQDIKSRCRDYEDSISQKGGIDLQLLGIGQNGHIGFNEPGSNIYTLTRLVQLDTSTRLANARDFENISKVPRLAITTGIGTILKSKRIILMAWGNKAEIVALSTEGPITEHVPASFLQLHNNCSFVIETSAARLLTRFKSPWLCSSIEWDKPLMKRAVIGLALQVNKPILSLTEEDYNEGGLGELLVEKGSAYQTNLEVFYMLRDSITGWPGGKPNAVIPQHPERSSPYPKTSLIFSPHPDDDIISMGGTFMRLVEHGHQVHVAYQTSGNIAVTNEFVTRFIDFAKGFEQLSGVSNNKSEAWFQSALHKTDLQPDTPEIRAIKGLIRRTEASATCRYVGLPDGNWHFMNLPFYETGAIEKNPISAVDIDMTKALLRKIKPLQVFAAGDFADPHGTHLTCFKIVEKALQECREEGDQWINNCWLWLYKGAWEEWDIAEIEMAIPMSPEQVLKKRHGIFIHQSQKDSVPFQGGDSREFWQRAVERNAETAKTYAQLGLTQYAAMEAFVRWLY
jgi:glucosamine-6-phosphate deaminase